MHRFIQCIIQNHTDAVITAAALCKMCYLGTSKIVGFIQCPVLFMSNFHISQSVFFTRLLQNRFDASTFFIFYI